MQRGALPDLNTFLLVAEHLSFRAAAERLELTAPAVSHAIRQLEGRLGVRLLNRTTRSVSHAGIRLVDRLRPAFDQISGAIEELNEERRRPVGRLRIWASPMATTIVVTTIWQRYLSTYPDVQPRYQGLLKTDLMRPSGRRFKHCFREEEPRLKRYALKAK
jgi:DNA-binding transcriptional LysR family regulator